MSVDSDIVILSGGHVWVKGEVNLDAIGEKLKGEKASRKNLRRKGQMVHHIFSQVKELEIEDPFWISIFDDAIYGTFPRGFRYSNGTLTYKGKGSKISKVDVDESNAEYAYTTIKEFMQFNGLLSQRDSLERQARAMEESTEDNYYTKWSEVKSQSVRRVLICDYINRLVEKYKLTKKEHRCLDSIIKLSIVSGKFNSNNITMSKGLIDEIMPLVWCEEYRTFLIDEELVLCTKKKRTAAKKDDTEDLDEIGKSSLVRKWCDFVDSRSKALQSDGYNCVKDVCICDEPVASKVKIQIMSSL